MNVMYNSKTGDWSFLPKRTRSSIACRTANSEILHNIDGYECEAWNVVVTLALRSWLQFTILLISYSNTRCTIDNNCCMLCHSITFARNFMKPCKIRGSTKDNPQYRRNYLLLFNSPHGRRLAAVSYFRGGGMWYLCSTSVVCWVLLLITESGCIIVQTIFDFTIYLGYSV